MVAFFLGDHIPLLSLSSDLCVVPRGLASTNILGDAGVSAIGQGVAGLTALRCLDFGYVQML